MKKSFLEATEVGTFAEKLVAKLLAGAGIPSDRNPEKSDRKKMSLWDLIFQLGPRRFTIEVKHDLMEAKTKNLAVEYWNTKSGKPSGILATASDLWVFVLQQPMTVWIARTADLKRFFDTEKPLREILCGGDQNSAMKLYRREVLLTSVFQRLDGLDPDETRSLIKEMTSLPSPPLL